jgi:archaellum component FlaC
MKEKDITIDDLATSVEDLAGMVKTGFDEMGKQFEKVDKRFEQMDNRLTALEKGQEDIKLRLDNVAYRFELVEVLKRLKTLEDIVLSKPKRYSRGV